jgi:CRP-like cAMP-binding protein
MNRSAIHEAVSRSLLFQEVGEDALASAVDGASSRAVEAGDAVLRQGDPASQLFLLARGLVKMSQVTPGGSEIALRFMGPGDLIGCVAVFQRFPYPATALAVEDSVVLAWSAARIGALLDAHPKITANALRIVSLRAHEFQERLGEAASGRAEQRVARALLRLAHQTGRRVEGGVEVGFHASLRDLAETTNVAYHTVSRILSAWRREGLIDNGRHRILVKAPHRLFEIAEDL